jgi:hypothetical protein
MFRRLLQHLPQLIAIALLATGIISLARPTDTYAGSKKLTVNLYGQAASQWCWAAADRMIMSFRGVNPTQCDIVNKIFGSACPNNPATVDQAASALGAYGFQRSIAYQPLGTAKVPAEINANRPVWVRWQWYGGGGHAVVITGYDSDAYGSATWVYYNDPLPENIGTRASLSWSNFMDGPDHRGWGHYWTDTIWKIYK